MPFDNFSFLGNQNRTCSIPRGRGLGGGSLLYGLWYTRGNRLDYDKWAKIVNDSGWSYEKVLPFFKKSENFTKTIPHAPIDCSYHGYRGPLHTTQIFLPDELSSTIIAGTKDLGYNITDYNGRHQLGASYLQYIMKDGKRFDHEMAFLSDAEQRKNLKILDSSYVIKVDVDGKSKRVKGVVFTRKNKTYFAKVRKEVILSAGAISSPQILMLSGIGPADHLESLGIPVVQNLPVGKTLRDHTMGIVLLSSNITVEPKTLRDSLKDFLKGEGTLTRNGRTNVISFFQTPLEEVENYPDLEFLISNYAGSNILGKYFSFSDETSSFLNQNIPNPFSMNPIVLDQKSFGTVTLRSASPFDYPLINPNILSDKDDKDIETLYQGVQIVLKLTKTEAFRRMNVSLVVKQFPKCSHTVPMSRDYWYCYFRMITSLTAHEMGTCPMGTSSKTGVVDNELNVFGIKGLRVADASIFPFAIRAHLTAPCTMVGEKVADIIKKYYKY